MTYNMTFDKGNIGNWYLGINTALSGWLSYALLVIVFAAPFIYYMKLEQNPIKGMIAGSLISATIGMFLAFMGAISWEISLIPLVLLLISLILKQFVE